MSRTHLSKHQKTKVLYVDDEEGNLSSFKASFRRECKVFLATSPAEGLKILEEEPDFHVVIADQRMPQMTGTEFLSKVKDIYPDTVRMLLTGYSDIEAVADAINKGQVYRYIDKTWDYKNIQTAIVNARDIYDTKMELREKNESLEKALKELDHFVYSVSHDLRAPLASILGIVNLAKIEIKDATSLEYFDMIKSMVDKLDTFLHQVIDYYYGNRNNTSDDEINFNQLVEGITEGYLYDPATRDVSLDIQLDSDGSKFISNEVKLKIILGNLISNAIKYQKENNDDQKVDIHIEVKNGAADITIRDNGVGISEEMKEKVFEMFYRASHKSLGSGLGLYIVKESVESLGGTIDLNSLQGEGTTISIHLPALS